MRNVDFTPLYRSTIGYDRMANLLDSVTRLEQGQPTYPPYNIELLAEDKYRITMAVAGFSSEEVELVAENGKLAVTGKKAEEDKAKTYLHKGIASRSFERNFQLADHVKVANASLENGLLHIDLVREIPEAMKPRKIAINSGDSKSQIANAA